MKIAITGASGFLGTALSQALRADGVDVVALVRTAAAGPNEITWSPTAGTIDADKLRGVDAVVHLAAESLIGLRWTAEKKRRILDSRVDGTALIARTLAALDGGPRVLISASAIGYYGDGSDAVDEDSPRGAGFAAEVCEAWENAADPARDAGIRVVHPRIGLVLSREGGLLGQMLPAFQLGLGGPIGSGKQWFSWVSVVDVVGAIRFAIDSQLSGPVNVVAPGVVTNAEFTRALARALHRPAFFRLPAAGVRLAMGQMGEETLLSGQRVVARRLLDAGYVFAFRQLEDALRREFG